MPRAKETSIATSANHSNDSYCIFKWKKKKHGTMVNLQRSSQPPKVTAGFWSKIPKEVRQKNRKNLHTCKSNCECKGEKNPKIFFVVA